jgi:hypothetical protein
MSNMSNAAILLRITLLERFDCLLKSLETLCTRVNADHRLPVWVSRTERELAQGVAMRSKAVALYRALWYEDGQDGRGTLTCPGIVAASQATLGAATECNAAKDAFKTAVLALKELPRADARDLMADFHRRNQEVAVVMKRMGVARLNLKQAYRHIPFLTTRPRKIGFTWSKQGRTIQRTTVAEAKRLLERRRPTPQIELELARLGQVPETEILARVRSVCPHLRANVVFDASPAGVERRLLQTPLPLLNPLEAGEPLPEFVPIGPQPPETLRLQRSDVRIEDNVFLPSIGVYRYRQPYR